MSDTFDKSYIDEIMDSYDDTPSPIDSITDVTDVQWSQIRDTFINDSTREYQKDHSRNWKFWIKLKPSW